MPETVQWEMSVAGIHEYPLHPEGFEEPLFPTSESRRAIAEHLLSAPWLSRASELKGMAGRNGQAAHARRERVEVERCPDGARLLKRRRRRRRVVEVISAWREVGRWWDERRAADRVVYRVLLSDGAVVDLAREREGWFLVGVTD
jgi:hypothetical protein